VVSNAVIADAALGAATELLFVVLPLLVVGVVGLHHEETAWKICSSPEWSFGAAILFGQAIVKMIAAASSGATRERASIFGSLAIVFGLVPALLFLSFVLPNEGHVAKTLAVLQTVWCVLGGITYTAFAMFVHIREFEVLRTESLKAERHEHV
jgi:hypothetical protein